MHFIPIYSLTNLKDKNKITKISPGHPYSPLQEGVMLHHSLKMFYIKLHQLSKRGGVFFALSYGEYLTFHVRGSYELIIKTPFLT